MKKIIFLLALILTACTSPLPSPPPPVTPTLWQVQYTPTLGWILPSLTHCAQEQPGIHLVIHERPAPALEGKKADFALRWGAPASLIGSATILGEDELVFITHPANPITQVTQSELRNLLAGKITAWSQLQPSAPGETIKVYAYGSGEDIQNILELTLPNLPTNRETGWLAPDPAAVRQVVASTHSAFGYIPKRWLNATVKSIKVTDLPTASLRQPVLALTTTEPTGLQKNWLLCLQAALR